MLNIPVDVQNLFKADSIRKDFRVHFPNGELADFNAANVVEESVRFTESLCSQQYLKFGLTEASEIEFETVGIGNMMGFTIQCACEIDISSLGAAWIAGQLSNTDAVLAADDSNALQADSANVIEVSTTMPQGLSWLDPQITYWDDGTPAYRVPYGEFIVDSCPRNHGAMTHRRITAYSKLRESTEYIDYILGGTYSTESITIDQNLIYQYLISNSDIAAQTQISSTFDMDYSLPARQEAYTEFAIPAKRLGSDITINFRAYTDTTNGAAVDPGALPSGLYRMVIDGLEAGLANLADKIKTFINFWGITFEDMTTGEAARLIAKKCVVFTNYGLRGDGVMAYGQFMTSKTDYLIYIPPVDAPAPDTDFMFLKSVTGLTATWTRAGGTESASIATTGNPCPLSTAAHVHTVTPTNTILPAFTIDVENSGQPNENIQSFSYTNAFDPLDMVDGALELCGLFVCSGRLGLYYTIPLDASSPYAVSPSDYSECWWDEYDIDDIGSVICKVKKKNNDDEMTYTFPIGSGESVYEMDSNFVLQTNVSANISSIVNNYFSPAIGDINFTPVDLSMRGLPFLEAGDYLSVTAEDGTVVNTFILRHTIQGIQSLQDTIESTGGELMTAGEVVTNGN